MIETPGIFAGGEGDGHNLEWKSVQLSEPQINSVFAGGAGDGHDVSLSALLRFPVQICVGNRLYVNVETSEGKLIDCKGVEGRYLRLYSKGSHVSDDNHYTEVEVFGKPAA